MILCQSPNKLHVERSKVNIAVIIMVMEKKALLYNRCVCELPVQMNYSTLNSDYVQLRYGMLDEAGQKLQSILNLHKTNGPTASSL